MGFFWKTNQEAEQRINETIDLAIKSINKHFDKEVLSIILIGSLPRGEGVWKMRDDKVEIVSDLDLLLILGRYKAASPKLFKELKKIEDKTHVEVNLKIKSQFKMRLLPKDTHIFDISQTAKVVYGQNLLHLIPKVNQNDLGKESIEAIFFNRALLNIEKCSPRNLISSSAEDLLTLSYLSARTMFTCMDIISIYKHNYSPFATERVKIAQEHLEDFEIPQKPFLRDLNTAFGFVFEQPSRLVIEEIYDYWERVRQYLLKLFLFTTVRGKDSDDIYRYPFLKNSSHLPCLEKTRSIYKRLKTSCIIYKKYKRFKLFWRIHPILYLRMASLMLYMAIDRGKEEVFTRKALEYFSNVYPLKNEEQGVRNAWTALRDRLLEFHKLGLF